MVFFLDQQGVGEVPPTVASSVVGRTETRMHRLVQVMPCMVSFCAMSLVIFSLDYDRLGSESHHSRHPLHEAMHAPASRSASPPVGNNEREQTNSFASPSR